tara:strand:+ start:43 stop:216 length:174 start_codon:yes stop_codon:yes gene_type:complete
MKKSELLQAINTFATARVSQDPNLINFSANLLQQFVDQLDFEDEEEAPVATDAPSDA